MFLGTVREELMKHVTQSQMSAFFTDKMKIYNVLSYGAKGDGVIDDGGAWNTTRADIPVSGGIMWVPSGNYKLTTAFTFGGKDNIVLFLSPGAVLSGAALPSPTGNNIIIDHRRDQSAGLIITAATFNASNGAVLLKNSGTVIDSNFAGGNWAFGEITDAAWVDEKIAGQTAAGTNWTTPNNALVDDANYAVYNATTQDWLKITNFGLFVPAEALGIRVSIKGNGAGATAAERTIKIGLTKDGTNTVGNIKTVVLNQTTDTEVTAGGGTDLWGTTWSRAELNSANFGVFIADNDTEADQIKIQYVAVTVVYNSGVSIFEVRSMPGGGIPLTVGSNSVVGVYESYVAKPDVGTDNTYRPALLIGSRNGQSYIRCLGEDSGGGVIIDVNSNLRKSRTNRGVYLGTNASGQIRLYAMSAMTSAEMANARDATQAGLTIGTNNKVIIGGSGTGISKHLSVTATWDPPSLADGAVAATLVTVTGAAVGDTALASFNIGGKNMLLSAFVEGVDTVRVVLMNKDGVTHDLSSSTLRVDVWKH